jgi:ribosomal protein S18 acetylase RimI-like enzyme
MLPEMAEPGLSGAAPDLWLIAGEGPGLASAAPERLPDGPWNLLALEVMPALLGWGPGTALVGACAARRRRQGGRRMLVEPSGTPGLARTRAFYRRLGFHRKARIRGYHAPVDDKVIFTRPLEPRGEGPGP